MYDGLLLSTGGGIITDIKKSAQQGEPTIIIGLGGTGIDALRVIKKKVYEQLIPDNPDGDIPEYKCIGFLAVDTDYIDTDYGEPYDLERRECLNIGVTNLNVKMKMDIESGAEEFKWLQPNLNLHGLRGAGTIRQVGRYCLFKNIDKITYKIRKLKRDVTVCTGVPEVNVHIIAGISGGTGGGTFIDMCYIVRDLLGVGSTLFGYFFMPDVNLNKPGIPEAIAVRIRDNGYAALKELDYTMNLRNEGETFSQYYGGADMYSVIKTNKPLVDLCYLVSATERNGVSIPDGYMYSMNTVGECILSYLAKMEIKPTYTLPPQTLQGHLANALAAVGALNKEHGTNLNYHILGVSAAELPTKEIGTYLAAKLYHKIVNGLTENVPASDDVENHAEKMGLTLGNIQDRLSGEDSWRVTNSSNIRWQGKYDFSITDAINTTVSITGSKITLTMPDVILDPIRSWKNENSGILEKNFNAITKDLDDFKLITKGTKADTLVSSVFQYLQNNVVSNFSYGAIYASKLTYNNHDKSLNDYLDGLITTAERTVSQWQGDLDLRAQSIENAVAECKKNSKKRVKKQNEAVEQYKGAVRAYYQALLDIEVGKKIIAAIAILKKQINLKGYKNSLYPMYFKPMESMLTELKETFKSNLEFLHNPAVGKDVFVWKMVEFDEIKNHVDTQFAAWIGDEASEYKDFVKNIMEQYEKWSEGNRYKVEKMIASYIGKVFKPILGTSMGNFLMALHPMAIKTELLENGVLAKAEPKFYMDCRYEVDAVEMYDLNVPAAVPNICAAAQSLDMKQPINVRCTGIGDRISATKFESGIPLYAYGLIDELEKQYNAGGNSATGRHLYEITDRNKDIDWASLPSVIPYSIRPQSTPDGEEIVNLYKEAESVGIIAGSPRSSYDYCVYELEMPQLKDRYDFADGNEFQEYIKMLNSYRDAKGKVSPDATMHKVHSLCNDGSVDYSTGSDYRETCRIDYFIQFKNLQAAARNSIAVLGSVDKALEEANNWIKEAKGN